MSPDDREKRIAPPKPYERRDVEIRPGCRRKKDTLQERKARFQGLNAFAQKHGGWIASIPGDRFVDFQCLPGSQLPDQFRALGYKVESDGTGQRILHSAIVERFARYAFETPSRVSAAGKHLLLASISLFDPRRAHPHVALLAASQDHRHRLSDGSARPPRSAWSSGSHRRCEAQGSVSIWCRDSPLNSVQIPAKANSGRSSFKANQTTSFLVSGFGSGAYSAKLLAGTRHRLPGFSQPRQCDDDVLRILVTGGPPLRGGVGIPQRIVVSSRSASTLRTTGAGMWLIAFISNESLINV
jgi:hypothetical protein